MHIGLIIYDSLDTVSGGYVYDRELVAYLRRQGDAVEIISLEWRDYTRRLGDNLSTALLRRLAGLRLDILLQDELNHPSLFWINRRLRRQVKFPMIAIVHHLHSSEARPAWQNRFYRWIERLYLSSVDGFIFNSQTTRRAVEEMLPGRRGACRPAVVACPAGDRLKPHIQAGEIARRARQPGPLRLIFLGNVIPRKGLHTLLEALRPIPRQAWKLEVVGSLEMDRRYARAVHRQAERAGMSESVTFTGALDDGQIAARLQASHVLVVPSSYEGFGIVYLEGMGFGLPAIASRSGAAGEIITHEQDGYLIEPGDAAALAGHLINLASDRQQLVDMSLAARQRYEQHPTWEQTTQRIRSFLYEQT